MSKLTFWSKLCVFIKGDYFTHNGMKYYEMEDVDFEKCVHYIHKNGVYDVDNNGYSIKILGVKFLLTNVHFPLITVTKGNGKINRFYSMNF